MAERDEITKCYRCKTNFDNLKNIPRLLPCTDTLCQSCVKESICTFSNHLTLTCPVCKTKHLIDKKKGEYFPQNKYILHIVKLVKESKLEHQETGVGESVLARCKEHNRELGLYCKNSSCKKAICQKCYLVSHRTHNIIDIEEKEKLELIEAVKDTLPKVAVAKKKIKDLKNEQDIRLAKTTQCLEARNTELINRLTDEFQQHSNMLRYYGELYKNQMGEKLESLTTSLKILSDIKEADFVYEEYKRRMESVNLIKDNVAKVSMEIDALQMPLCTDDSIEQHNKLLKAICGDVQLAATTSVEKPTCTQPKGITDPFLPQSMTITLWRIMKGVHMDLVNRVEGLTGRGANFLLPWYQLNISCKKQS